MRARPTGRLNCLVTHGTTRALSERSRKRAPPRLSMLRASRLMGIFSSIQPLGLLRLLDCRHRLGHLEEAPAQVRPLDPVIDTHQFERFALADGILFRLNHRCRLSSATACDRSGCYLFRHSIEEVIHIGLESLRQIIEAAGANPICATLVLLYLLKGQPDRLTKPFLAHAEKHAPTPQASADVSVDRVGTPRAPPSDTLALGHFASRSTCSS